MPYLYTCFEEAHRTGAPILRPLLFNWRDDEVTYTADDEFLFGPSIIVVPIARPGIEYRHVYLPRGTLLRLRAGPVRAKGVRCQASPTRTDIIVEERAGA